MASDYLCDIHGLEFNSCKRKDSIVEEENELELAYKQKEEEDNE